MKAFPRVGAFAMMGTTLAIVSELGERRSVKVEEPDPKRTGKTRMVMRDVVDTTTPFATLDTVDLSTGDTHGERLKTVANVPFDDFRQATYAELRALNRPGVSDLDPAIAHAAGYVVDDATLATLPPLTRRRLGLALSDADAKAADDAHAAEQQAARDAQHVANDPDVQALDRELADAQAATASAYATKREQLARIALDRRAKE